MNKRIKGKWLKALRSGAYKQGRESLCRENSGGDSFCCLGVLTQLYIDETGKGYWEAIDTFQESDWLKGTLHYDGAIGGLPYEVCRWAGLVGPDPEIEGTALSTHNDGGILIEEKTFKQIARLIEEHL